MDKIEAIKSMMASNIVSAKAIYELCKQEHLMDSSYFVDWQDELNSISIAYE